MKRSINFAIATLQTFSHPSMVCLGFDRGFANGFTNGCGIDPFQGTLANDSRWTKALVDTDSKHFISIEFLRGLVAEYLNRPELYRHKRSGERPALPI